MHLADTQAIAHFTRRTPATIRSWAHRGLITRQGTGKRGIALYSVEEAETVAMRVDMRNSRCNAQVPVGQLRPGTGDDRP